MSNKRDVCLFLVFALAASVATNLKYFSGMVNQLSGGTVRDKVVYADNFVNPTTTKSSPITTDPNDDEDGIVSAGIALEMEEQIQADQKEEKEADKEKEEEKEEEEEKEATTEADDAKEEEKDEPQEVTKKGEATEPKKEEEETPKPTKKTKPTMIIPPKKVYKDQTPIRSWGCDNHEAPLIFVHNGKSGGGSIRARFAAAALNANPNRRWSATQDDHYYPIKSTTNKNETRKGRFCNSLYPHFADMPHIEVPLSASTYEGQQLCNATTPLGILLTCHMPHKWIRKMADLKVTKSDRQTTRKDRNKTPQIQAFAKRVERKKRRKQSKAAAQKKEEEAKKGRRKLQSKAHGGQPNKQTHINEQHYRSTHCMRCDDDYYLEPEYYIHSVTGKKIYEIPPEVLDASQDPYPACDVVLTAHNNIGSELTFLPYRYLKEVWWEKSPFFQKNDAVEAQWKALMDDRQRRRDKLQRMKDQADEDENADTSQRWCPMGYTVNYTDPKEPASIFYDKPTTAFEYRAAYDTCSVPKAIQADQVFMETYFADGAPKNFAPFYASMPVQRTTMMRDPWAWIVSKFFWHNLDNRAKPKEGELPCYDVHALVPAKSRGVPVDPMNPTRQLGWMEAFSLLYLIKLCGDECRMRYENAMMTLDDIEEQAASNLRQSFTVVGLLHEQDSFFDMVHDRVAYMDMSLNLDWTGSTHETGKTPDNLACKALYATDEAFRQNVRDTVPAFAALERVYHLGIEVNRFQKEELKQCKLAKGEEPTHFGKYLEQGTQKREKRTKSTTAK